MPNVYFTSDTHFWHRNILTLGNGRPFETIEEMNETLIENWNARVKPEDTIYFLGDLSWAGTNSTREITRRLSGHKHWILGNHDIRGLNNPPPVELRWDWESITHLINIKVDHQLIVLAHYPFAEWDKCHKGSWHLHGHQHGNAPTPSIPRIDVGVDCFNFAPVSYEEIAKIMTEREWTPTSHH